jgi:hypothetical protein
MYATATTSVNELISQEDFENAIARAPMDEYVIWTGARFHGRPGSIPGRMFSLVTEAWGPVPLRILLRRAARLAITPDRARNAVRAHQSARGASYFLVRRTSMGEFVLVTDIPFAAGGARLAAGSVVECPAPAPQARRAGEQCAVEVLRSHPR